VKKRAGIPLFPDQSPPSDEPQTCQPNRASRRYRSGARHLACLTQRFEEPALKAIIISKFNQT
jgi:hypothetical protein